MISANKRLAACYSVKNYDPESSDESWICIFCKLSAHSPGLAGEPTGELFGPYFIQSGNDSDSKRHSRKTDHLTEPIKKKVTMISRNGLLEYFQFNLITLIVDTLANGTFVRMKG